MILQGSSSVIKFLMNEYGLSKKETILIDRFANMKPKGREDILEYITSIAKDLQIDENSTDPE